MPLVRQPTSLSAAQRLAKTAAASTGGIVAAQHGGAARVGAAVLAAGGDAVDAAVAVSFAMGVLEPWMSGPAGGGAMMLWRAEEGRAHAVDYGMRAPRGLDPAAYPLSGDGRVGDLFPWEAVVEDRNIHGATAVAVPGLVDGIGQVHARFGRMPWRDLVLPAAALAREGLRVDWYAGLMIAGSARILAQDPDAAALFLEDGQWPPLGGWTALTDVRIRFPRMAETLERIAENGARELYDGEVGEALARDVAEKGGPLRVEDLRAYRATIREPLSIAHRGGRFHLTPEMTAGPTFAHAFAELGRAAVPVGAPDAASYGAMAAALKAAYAERLERMGDENEAPSAPASTTHFSIVDRHGNMVSVTQTLLSAFGSRVVSPSTGLLLNNGIMWFDPVPGRPNSLGPDKRCLMNVCPAIGERGDRRFALGASGGRKILAAVAQLSAFLADHGMALGDAFDQPRIDVSGAETVVADDRLPEAVQAALAEAHPVVAVRRTPYPFAFACPSGVMREDGVNHGATEPMSPWGEAVAEAPGS